MSTPSPDESSGFALRIGAVAVVLLFLVIAYARSGGNGEEEAHTRDSGAMARVQQRLQRLGSTRPAKARKPRVAAGKLPEPRKGRIDAGISARPGPPHPLADKGLARPTPKPLLAEETRPGAVSDSMIEQDPENIPMLAKMALDDPDPERRLAAVTLLGASEDPAAIPILANALGDDDEEVRMSAVQALADFTEQAPVEAVERALNDPSADVRYEALEVLGEFGGERARQAIERAQRDPDEDVQWLAESLIEDFDIAEGE